MASLVYIVDDQDDYRFLVQQVFKRYLPSYSTRFFANGKTFLEQLPKLTPLPSLILLDHNMPELDGHQTLLYLKGHSTFKKIPVVMMSADASALEINGCYEAGVNSFFRKSLDFESIRRDITLLCAYWLGFNQRPADQSV